MKSIRRVPIIGEQISVREIYPVTQFFSPRGQARELFQGELQSLLGKKQVFLFNSGIASFYALLEALKTISSQKEVVLPAYTAGSLVVAIQKAHLKPVLCDISLDDFNLDFSLLHQVITRETLCVLGVHMFGIPCQGFRSFQQGNPGVRLIEDCAQSFGSKIEGHWTGTFAETSFFSFNRGKNLPTMAGGCLATDNAELAQRIDAQLKIAPEPSAMENAKVFIKKLGFSLAVKPLVYGMVHGMLSRFKELSPPADIEVKKYSDFQARLGMVLLERFSECAQERFERGRRISEGLVKDGGLQLPVFHPGDLPVFNRYPVIFHDLRRREKIESALSQAGIETSRMYLRPLHHFFELGYAKTDFPQACYLAEHLLVLPVHSLVQQNDIERMVEIIRAVK